MSRNPDIDRKPIGGERFLHLEAAAADERRRCHVLRDVWEGGCRLVQLQCAGPEMHQGDMHYDARRGVFWEEVIYKPEYTVSGGGFTNHRARMSHEDREYAYIVEERDTLAESQMGRALR